jgi:predicted NBD/HSP70 family sugar kinase
VGLARVSIGQRSETVRRANLSTILRDVHERGAMSRSALVARTGLTRSAIRGLIGELVAADLVTEERAERLGSPGRPSPLVHPNPDGAAVLALEIAVDSLAVAIVGLGGSVLRQVRVDRPRGHLSADAIVADLVDLATQARRKSGGGAVLVGTGVAVVGTVRRADGFVSLAPNLGWRDEPLGERLGRTLGFPGPIQVGNEADLGALGEVHRGAAVGVADVVFISGEVGVGGGIIVGGVPLSGVAGYAGEVGHMPVNPAGHRCRCGSIGCWETEVGEDALLRRAGYPYGGGPREIDAVVRGAESGSPEALAALEELGRWLGLGLAGLVNIFNPRLVVLGGLFGRIHPFVAPTIEGELDRLGLASSRGLVRVLPAALGVDAPLIGAAELAFEPLLADPAAWLGRQGPFVRLVSA